MADPADQWLWVFDSVAVDMCKRNYEGISQASPGGTGPDTGYTITSGGIKCHCGPPRGAP